MQPSEDNAAFEQNAVNQQDESVLKEEGELLYQIKEHKLDKHLEQTEIIPCD